MPDYLDPGIFKCSECGSHKLLYNEFYDVLVCCVCEKVFNVDESEVRM